jgi:hypothetical protein
MVAEAAPEEDVLDAHLRRLPPERAAAKLEGG